VLLLHGGPGMSFDTIDGLAEDIGEGFQVAAYQQRGLAPSTEDGPFSVEREVADAVAVLDALSWDTAWLVGHSWGGHLLLHLVVARPERLSGGLAVDPLGGVGDGGEEAFEAEMFRRTPEPDRERAQVLDERAMRGDATAEESLESMRLVWPAYFASPDHVMPFEGIRLSVPAYAAVYESLVAERSRLESALGAIRVPIGFVAGERSPMPPAQAAEATARAIPGASVEVVPDAGHFPWFERPGCVRAALRRLMRTAEEHRALGRIRELCLALPGTEERLSHGSPTFFFRGKRAFASYLDDHHGDGRLAIWCAAPPGMQNAFVGHDPERYFVPPYVGHRGWLGVRLDRGLPWDDVAGALEDAYETVAG
jgi:pimeloyl-ACP methyl ester carboxylesterase